MYGIFNLFLVWRSCWSRSIFLLSV